MNDPKDKPVSQLTDSELLAELVRRKAQQAKLTDLTAMELTGEDFGERAKDALMQARIDALGPEGDEPKKCPRCSADVPVRARHRRRVIKTLSGSVRLVRNYHYCRKCKLGFFPRDIEIGLPSKGAISSELERRVLDFAINDPFEQAAERWSMHYTFSISSNLLRRVTDRVGRRCEGANERHLQTALQPRARKAPALLIVQNDGSMLPTRDDGWREAKLAMVTRSDKMVLGRGGQRGMTSEARYVAVLGDPDALAKCLGEALHAERATQAEEVVWLADGAPLNWRMADRLQPGCTQVLDWHHALEHAMTCARSLLGEADPLLAVWQKRSEQLLLRGANSIISELMDCLDEANGSDQRGALNALVRYYRTNETRMHYARYLEAGYPIASGAIESAHRHVLQTRMKRAGQRWSVPRAHRLAKMRAAYRTAGARRLHAAIQLAANLTRTNIMSPRRRRQASNR
jgi:hypothetical protein